MYNVKIKTKYGKKPYVFYWIDKIRTSTIDDELNITLEFAVRSSAKLPPISFPISTIISLEFFED